MAEKKDALERFLKQEYLRISEKEKKNILEDEKLEVPEGLKETMLSDIEEKMEQIRREQRYAHLSEEERLAMQLGFKMLSENKGSEDDRAKENSYAARKKKRIKIRMTAVLAALLTLAIGITSIGGPERMRTFVKQAVNEREVEKINSDEENLTITEENEEEAYQVISDELGTEPVRIFERSSDLRFDRMEFDKEFQIAELYYLYGNSGSLMFIINASYAESSTGVSVEDSVLDTYTKTIQDVEFQVKEYITPKTQTKRYSASFEYHGLEYYIIGVMDIETFEFILNNLYFLHE